MKLLTKRWFIWLSVSLNILIPSFFIVRRFYNANTDPQHIAQFNNWNKTRQEILDMVPIDTGDIVFVGSSITEGFPLLEIFPSFKIKNRGINGNNSSHILGRIESIIAGKPKKIFLEIGINDILFKVPADTLFYNYTRIVDMTVSGSPGTQLFVQSVLPLSYEHKETNQLIREFNSRLQHYCAEKGLTYIDLYSLIDQDADQKEYFAFDGIHLTAKAYQLWANKIAGFL